MFRRVLACIGVIASIAVTVPSVAGAASGGGAVGTSFAGSMNTLTSGHSHTCTIANGGMVGCWGRNDVGQLGIGNLTSTNIASFATGITTATSVAAGGHNTCAVLADTTVKCWGDNADGTVGNGSSSASGVTTPTAVCAVGGCAGGSLTGVAEVSVGEYFACARLTGGTVVCWGRNDAYQLARPTSDFTSSSVPVAISGVSGALDISSGGAFTCAVVSGGGQNLICWGQGKRGQLGLGDGNNSARGANAVTRTGVTDVKAVATSGQSTCAINGSDNVLCWGDNNNNELGYQFDGDNSSSTFGYTYDNTIHNDPHTVRIGATLGGSSAFTATALAGGTTSFCAVRTSGALICWGTLYSGGASMPVGPNFSTMNTLAQLSGLTSVTNATVGSGHACATVSGIIKCWGFGGYGQLGHFMNTDSTSAAVNAIVPQSQTISFGSLADKTTADGSFTVTATSSAGTDSPGVTVKFSTSTTSVCSVTEAGLASIVGPGTCTIKANADGFMAYSGAFYLSATETTSSFTVTAVAPVISSVSADTVTTSGATINASVHSARATTQVEFSYSTSASMAGATKVTGPFITSPTDMASAKAVSTVLTTLAPGTKYWYTVSATNAWGTTVSSAGTFTTGGSAPTAATGSPTSVSAVRATLNGVVNPGDLSTTVWFVIGQKSDLSDGTKIDYRAVTGTAATDVSVTATGLTESARYYYRLEASNAVGSAKGDIKSFTSARPVGVSVNDAAEFTNSRNVTVYASGPSGSTQVIISNDGGFGSSQTFDLTDGSAEIPWTLVASRDERLPKTVYARFVQRFGTQSASYTDDIILDTTAPVMNGATAAASAPSADAVTVAAFRAAAKGGAKITVRAKDANSGIGKVQVKSSAGGPVAELTTGSPKATSRVVKVKTTKKKLWVRVVDRAGNVSKWVTVTVK